jgi:hypothetical protein
MGDITEIPLRTEELRARRLRDGPYMLKDPCETCNGLYIGMHSRGAVTG